jgi:hypothetical protein
LKVLAPRLGALAIACTMGCGSATDDRPPVWEYISPAILQPNCATVSCHSPAAAVAGLDFSTMERGYTSLTGLWVWIVDMNGTPEMGCRSVNGTIVCQEGHRPLVTPFDPSQSLLVHMLRAQGAARMPPDRPLPEADIELIERWILNGATWGKRSPFDAGVAASPPDAGANDGPTDKSAAHPDGAVDGGSNPDGAAPEHDGAPSDGALDAPDAG